MTQSKTLGVFMLEDVRIAFAHGIWNASKVGDDPTSKAAFSASFILPKNHKQLGALQQAMLVVAEAKWPTKGAETLKALIAGQRICLRDGDSKPDTAGYAGNLFISARSQTAPLVIDGARNVLTQAGGKPKSGDYVNARLSIWAQQHPKHGKRINAQLTGVQFVREGEALAGGSPASVEDFGEIEQAATAAAEFGDLFGVPAK